MTWVPDCKWYRNLRCTCEHVRFETIDGNFTHDWGKFWHLPTLQQIFTVQTRYQLESPEKPTGKHFWKASAINNFKNSLEVANFVGLSHARHNFARCARSLATLLPNNVPNNIPFRMVRTMIHSGTMCLVPITWYLLPGTRYLVSGIRHQAPGTRHQVSSTRYQLVPGIIQVRRGIGEVEAWYAI